jgi:hypothetical protein
MLVQMSAKRAGALIIKPQHRSVLRNPLGPGEKLRSGPSLRYDRTWRLPTKCLSPQRCRSAGPAKETNDLIRPRNRRRRRGTRRQGSRAGAVANESAIRRCGPWTAMTGQWLKACSRNPCAEPAVGSRHVGNMLDRHAAKRRRWARRTTVPLRTRLNEQLCSHPARLERESPGWAQCL